MLLKDTKVICVGSDTDAVNSLKLQLGTLDVTAVSQSQWQPLSNPTNAPVIWLFVFDEQKQVLSNTLDRFHPIHESCIYCLINMPRAVNQKITSPVLSVKTPANELYQVLISEEQNILQRHLFQSSEIKDELFAQLHFYGRSQVYVSTIETIEQFAGTDESILIYGETGTGKELTARSIHYLSKRKQHPFIPLNCGAFNDDLMLSELFGYEKGAFTGATKAKPGLLEVANKGTVFLDEVDSLSGKAQVALLRYLQDNEVRPVGSSEVKTVDVRVVAASNQNIKQLVKQGKFREDLMFRLDVLGITLPPLRERDEDIQLLAQYFLAQISAEYNNHKKVFSCELIEEMQTYDWPGNIRELENFIKRAYLLTKGRIISNANLFENSRTQRNPKSKSLIPAIFNKSFSDEKQRLVNQFERDYLHYVLKETRGNISKAANIARKERRSFCRLMQKHGLSKEQYINS